MPERQLPLKKRCPERIAESFCGHGTAIYAVPWPQNALTPVRRGDRCRTGWVASATAGGSPIRAVLVRRPLSRSAAEASPKQIAFSWAGHTSVAVVLDRYGHLFRAWGCRARATRRVRREPIRDRHDRAERV